MSNAFPQPPDTLTGRCMCGAVQYQVSAKPIAVALCRCDRCRPQSGSSFSMVVFLPRTGVQLAGEPAVFDHVGSSGLRVLRRYCPRCGSPLTTEPDLTPDILFLKSGGLDQTEWLHPTLELFVGRRLPFVLPIPDAVQFDGNPQV